MENQAHLLLQLPLRTGHNTGPLPPSSIISPFSETLSTLYFRIINSPFVSLGVVKLSDEPAAIIPVESPNTQVFCFFSRKIAAGARTRPLPANQ
jgi:hypothetical protein